jgi:hypothetical protein
MKSIINTLAGLKAYLSFSLHVLALVLMFALAVVNKTDVGMYMVYALFSYMGGRSIVQASSFFAASKDPNCDTAHVIESMKEK